MFAVFGPGLVGGFVWDDRTLIVSNAYLRDADLATLLRGDFWRTSARGEADGAMLHACWRPVVTLAYALQYKLFGESPFGYHLVNEALHLGCSLLAWGFVRRRVAGDDVTRDAAATVGALVFAAHPSRPESVTWARRHASSAASCSGAPRARGPQPRDEPRVGSLNRRGPPQMRHPLVGEASEALATRPRQAS